MEGKPGRIEAKDLEQVGQRDTAALRNEASALGDVFGLDDIDDVQGMEVDPKTALDDLVVLVDALAYQKDGAMLVTQLPIGFGKHIRQDRVDFVLIQERRRAEKELLFHAMLDPVATADHMAGLFDAEMPGGDLRQEGLKAGVVVASEVDKVFTADGDNTNLGDGVGLHVLAPPLCVQKYEDGVREEIGDALEGRVRDEEGYLLEVLLGILLFKHVLQAAKSLVLHLQHCGRW